MSLGRMSLGPVQAGALSVRECVLGWELHSSLKSFAEPAHPPASANPPLMGPSSTPFPAIPGFFSDHCFRTPSVYCTLGEGILSSLLGMQVSPPWGPPPSFPSKVTFWPVPFPLQGTFLFEVSFVASLWDRTVWIPVTTSQIPDGTSREGMFALASVWVVPVYAWWLCCLGAMAKQSVMPREAKRDEAAHFIAVREQWRSQTGA